MLGALGDTARVFQSALSEDETAGLVDDDDGGGRVRGIPGMRRECECKEQAEVAVGSEGSTRAG